MTLDILAPETAMGAVSLKVSDLDAMIAFYRDGVGLTLIAHDGPTAILGRAGNPALILEVAPELKHAPSTAAGLYHTAFLFGEKSDLASSVYSVARAYPRNFTGSSDHFVSEAFYFNDPEGNGVELYWDRPRDSWKWQNGSVEMGTVYLDPNRFLQENLTEAGLTAATGGETSVGHVHLKVGDIQTAKQFYVDTVGFEITIEYGTQALFVSAGGYHHHVGMNTWESNGAGARTPALGLGQVAIHVPSTEDIGTLAERLTARGIQQAHDGRMLTFADPWENQIRVTAAA